MLGGTRAAEECSDKVPRPAETGSCGPAAHGRHGEGGAGVVAEEEQPFRILLFQLPPLPEGGGRGRPQRIAPAEPQHQGRRGAAGQGEAPLHDPAAAPLEDLGKAQTAEQLGEYEKGEQRGQQELREKLLSMKRSGTPIGVVHESPHRVIELVRTIGETLPGCRISASCDLTKLHEKTIRGTAEEVLALLEANEKAEKGEYCLVLDMSGVELETQEEHSAASLEAQLFEEMLSGFDLRQAALTLTERGHKRNDVYRARTNVQRFLDDLMSDYTLEEEDDSDE